MRYLENILGIGDLRDSQSQIKELQRRYFDVQTDLMCKTLAQITMIRGEIETVRKEFQHFSAMQAWGENPHDGEMDSVQAQRRNQHPKESSCTLEKENTQYKAIVNFLTSRKQATTQQIYHAVKNVISTQNKDGKRGAVYSALSRLRHHGFVKKVSHGVYQIKGE